ncbi:FKBP-type peptidyl-prolyl cis-trans isomerase [Sulfurospirillum arcachonense]|uniref:FKBP-type peptidyl-prolyl cis-trans isomerase n=1 Tax=Sulfurospirillum arcachonense TaxID=57666 RepID=UPI000468E5BB|nr:FKBP-type peptidyl-prolyl cis-trans isomerase [Sulfurospirillum arcachonense]
MKLAEKKVYLILPMLLALVGTQSFASELKTSVQKESYSIGASTGNYIVNQVYGQVQMGAKIDMDSVLEGFNDALKKKLKLNEEEIITNLNNRAEYLNKAKKEKILKLQQDNSKKEKDYLQKNSKKDGVKVTKSGLQYEIIKDGKGQTPKPESIVVINYKASLIDGYVFDSTYERKSPAHLSMINIVEGLKEGLMFMHEGSKLKLTIPSKLGYGDVQMRDIPPNSVLTFEVELLKVLKPGAMKQKKKFEMMSDTKDYKKKTLK